MGIRPVRCATLPQAGWERCVQRDRTCRRGLVPETLQSTPPRRASDTVSADPASTRPIDTRSKARAPTPGRRHDVADDWAPLELARPPFDQLAGYAGLLGDDDFPTLDALSDALAATPGCEGLRCVEQNQFLFRDGLHFEQRIHDHGAIATRPRRWHDLFSVLMWLRYPRLKRALNRLQVEDLPLQGRGNRTRRQQSLTHIDEAGLLVASEDPALLERLDAHDWPGLFLDRRADWHRRIVVHVFGHALFELARDPHLTMAGKVLWFHVPEGFCTWPFDARAALLDRAAADAVSSGVLGWDPAGMVSLPLSGIPGWREGNGDPAFVATAECFRGRDPQRRYAAPLGIAG